MLGLNPQAQKKNTLKINMEPKQSPMFERIIIFPTSIFWGSTFLLGWYFFGYVQLKYTIKMLRKPWGKRTIHWVRSRSQLE